MSRVFLDTSAYSAMQRGDQRLLELLREASEVCLNSVVLGELLFGFRRGRLEKKNRRLLHEFLASPRVNLLALDAETAERYAVIRDYLSHQGRPIPVNDLWIAASAFQYGARLLTLDQHFKNVPQVLLEYFEPATAGR